MYDQLQQGFTFGARNQVSVATLWMAVPGTLLAFQNAVPSKTRGEETGLKFSYCNADSVRKSDTLKNCLTSNV